MTDKFKWLMIGVSAVLMLSSSAFAQNQELPLKDLKAPQSGMMQKVKGGEIDWENMAFYASGEGAMPTAKEESNRARAYLKARNYAKMQAIAHLFMVVEGTVVSYEGYGKDYMAQDETLHQKIEGYLHNVELDSEKRVDIDGNTMVVVTVGTRMFGQGAPGASMLRAVSHKSVVSKALPTPVKIEIPKAQPEPVEAAPVANRQVSIEKELEPVVVPTQPAVEAPKEESTQKEESKPDEPKPAALATTDLVSPPAPAVGPFTSVIIDCRGFNVARAMIPKIRRSNGSEVWGTLKVDPDFVNETGIVGYATSMELAQKGSRCGTNPLIIKAIGRAGGAAMCDAIITDQDSNLVLAENNKTKFMDQFKVIFLVDPQN
jgi:hypothetical protein